MFANMASGLTVILLFVHNCLVEAEGVESPYEKIYQENDFSTQIFCFP